MQLTCPHCRFSKKIDPTKLPDGVTQASCPRCNMAFAVPQVEATAPLNEAAAAQIVTEVSPATTANQARLDAQSKAGFWLRVVATMIDTALLFGLQFVLGLLLMLAGVATIGSTDEMAGVVTLFGTIVGLAYYVVFTAQGGQTPGKMALRIKVICRDGSDVGYGKAVVRELFGKFISAIILGSGYLMVAFDEQKQGLHDRMADTYVIKL